MYYTYAYLRDNGKPYYIGKGKGQRAWTQHGRSVRTPKDCSKILILKKDLTERQAFDHERYMIFVLGRLDLGTGILRNLTDGGDGTSGRIHSEETKNKISVRRRLFLERNPDFKMTYSEERLLKMRERMSGENNPMYGKSLSEEHRAKISASVKGEKNGFYGRSHSEETKAKVSKMKRDLFRENPGALPWAKTYILTSPHGIQYRVSGRLEAFCKEHEISYKGMRAALHRKQTDPRPNGWSIMRLENQSNDFSLNTSGIRDEQPQPQPQQPQVQPTVSPTASIPSTQRQNGNR
jgi:group I intron endonuclease